MIDMFTIRSSALPSATRVAGFHGTEGISRLYRFDVYLVLTHDTGHEVDMQAAVGAKATLRLERRDGEQIFVMNGVIASLQLINDFMGRTVFHAVLVPRFWHLTQSMHSRLFTQQALPEILEAVLSHGGLAGAYSLQLLGSYATQEHVCQYQESDFDFVSRWMEREGLYYYFEQGEEEERLIITDDLSTHHKLGDRPINYLPQAEGVLTQGAFRAFSCRYSALPASVQLKDYDYARPTFEVSGQAPVAAGGVGQINGHWSRFFTPGEGAHLAQVKAQSMLAGQAVYQGMGSTPELRPGYLFDLDDHPRAAFNATYLTTDLEHRSKAMAGVPELATILPWDDLHAVEATAIPATVQFRAPQRTAWPRIYGGEHAVIDGPATSEYAQIDSHGRYRVKFHFDESDLTGGKASTWVRMLQPHGGGIEGFHFPLRAGTEVVCTFSGGDPDRPSIVGVAPNALTPSPVTSSNNTRNVIQTGGRNRLEIEDKAGLERITLSTPNQNSYLRMGSPNDDHNLILSTDGTMLIHSGQQQDVTIGANMNETVVGAVTEIYQSTKTETVTGALNETYNNIKNETVVDAVTTTYKSTETRSVATSKMETIGGGAAASGAAGQVWTQQLNGDAHITSTGSYKVTTHVNTETTTHGNSVSTTYGDTTATIHGTNISDVWGNRVSTTQLDSTSHVLGFNFSLVEGVSISNVLGGAVSATEGGAVNAVIGARVNYTLGPQLSFNTGSTSQFTTGLATTVITGAKFDNINGIKGEFVDGFSLKYETMKFETQEMAVKNSSMHVRLQQLNLASRALGVRANDLLVEV